MEVDEPRKRISLTLRLDDEPGKREKPAGRPPTAARDVRPRPAGAGQGGRKPSAAPAGGAMAEALRRAGLDK
jgi:uncharacterized protein